MRFIIITAVVTILLGCASVAKTSGKDKKESISYPDVCADNKNNSAPVTIEIISSYGSSKICRVNDPGNCRYSVGSNLYFESHKDFNADGRSDYLFKDSHSGWYGNPNDVVRLVGYVQCPDDTYVRVLDDMLKSIQVRTPATPGRMNDLLVTRGCLDEKSGSFITREYTLKFDQSQMEYGPPNGDPELARACFDKEQTLPPGSVQGAER